MLENPSPTPLRVAVIGHGPAAERACRVYADLETVDWVGRVSPNGDFQPNSGLGDPADEAVPVYPTIDALIETAAPQAVELHRLSMPSLDICERIAKAGIPIIFPKPFAVSLDEADRLRRVFARFDTRAYLLDPWLFHPFTDQTRELLRDGQVGEIQHIRVKSHIGSQLDTNMADFTETLNDPAIEICMLPPFDKAALIEHLMGPIDKLFAYGGAGRRMLALRFKEAGRYGVHEAVYSPQLPTAAGGDHSLEITGTDGILWLRNLDSCLVEAPKIRLKRKDIVTVWDDRAEYSPEQQERALRVHILEHLERRVPSRFDLTGALRAIAVNDAVRRSLAENRSVRVASLV